MNKWLERLIEYKKKNLPPVDNSNDEAQHSRELSVEEATISIGPLKDSPFSDEMRERVSKALTEPINVKNYYPMLKKRVLTPKGKGVLWQVFISRIGVVLDENPGWVEFFDPNTEGFYLVPLDE